MIDVAATVLSNEHIGAEYFKIRLKLARPFGRCAPGQFVMVHIPGHDLFLRRPFSIYDYSKRCLTIMYRVAGKGTEALSALTTGGTLTVLGPLGRGFRIDKSREALIVAGGIGIAGVAALIKRLKGKGTILFGCSSLQETGLILDFSSLSVVVSTLDGTYGVKGTVVDLVKQYLSRPGMQDVALYVCGPNSMAKSLVLALQDKPLSCQVLVEERMACGLGLCFGCVTKTTDEHEPYKRVCKEGPVFDLWELSL